jgi:hypothetical protein
MLETAMCPALEVRIDRLFYLYAPIQTYNIVDDLSNAKGLAPSVLRLSESHESVFSSADVEYKFYALVWLLRNNGANTEAYAFKKLCDFFTDDAFDKYTMRQLSILWALLHGLALYEQKFGHRPVSTRRFVKKYLSFGIDSALYSDCL